MILNNNIVKEELRKFIIKFTPFGPVAVVWSFFDGHPKIIRVLLSNPSSSADREVLKLFPMAVESSCAEIDTIRSDIEAFLHGEEVEFDLKMVHLENCSPFQQEVLRVEYGIPRGKVSTYGLIASHIGRPKAVRAVGGALATNPFPIIIPCHRAIRSDCHLGGYQGGVKMKMTLLTAEGIEFDESGRVIANRFYYSNNEGYL